MNTKIFILFIAILTAVVSGCAQDPKADAGDDQTTVLGETVTLSAAASDKNGGDSLSYTWSIVIAPEGSQAKLSDPAAMEPTFTPDKSGEYLFRLVVYNSWQSDPVEVKITCTPAPEPPPAVPVPPLATDSTGAIKVTTLLTSENFRTTSNVNFSTAITVTNAGTARANIAITIQGKNDNGDIIFTRPVSFSLDPSQTKEINNSFGEPLTIAEYDNITTWTVGDVVVY